MAGSSSAKVEYSKRRARQVQASVGAAVACSLCPVITPERGIEIIASATEGIDLGRTYKITNVVRERTEAVLGDADWRSATLAWISAFWIEHGHGPTWRQFLTAQEVWPVEFSPYLRRVTMAGLYRRGHLDGTKTPFGLTARVRPIARIPSRRRPEARRMQAV